MLEKHSDIQVIVVDDCSNETSVSVLKDKLEKEYPSVQFIYQNENGGGGRCRNEALKYAKGKWLVFADADDFFQKIALSCLINIWILRLISFIFV